MVISAQRLEIADARQIRLNDTYRKYQARSRTESIAYLQSESMAWAEKRNAQEAKVDWRFTTKDARIKLKRLYPSVE